MESNQAVRLARNIAEKQRRDKLNGYINELANAVPLVATASKRLDKTSILRLSAAYLRLHNSPLVETDIRDASEKVDAKSVVKWRPSDFNTDHLKVLMEAVDGFVIVANSDYKLIYVSQSCEKYLGHQNIDMMGYSLVGFVHPGDEDLVKLQIEKAKKELIQKGRMVSERISFRCRMRERNQPRTEVITYQVVQIVGNLTFFFGNPSADEPKSQPSTTTVNTTTTISRKRAFDSSRELTATELHQWAKRKTTDPSLLPQHIIFKGFVQIIPTSPMAELSLIDANLEEYVTRLSLDGTLLFADHRISMITGQMPHEVVNQSAYSFILMDDHAISLFAHKLMLSSSNGTGIIVHRLKTKGGGYVFVQSAGCLQYDRDTGQVDHFVCVSRLLVEEEGDKEREKFVRRFTPHISNCSPNSLFQSLQIVIGPRNNNKAYYSQTTDESSSSSTCASPAASHSSLGAIADSPAAYAPSPSPSARSLPMLCDINEPSASICAPPPPPVQSLSTPAMHSGVSVNLPTDASCITVAGQFTNTQQMVVMPEQPQVHIADISNTSTSPVDMMRTQLNAAQMRLGINTNSAVPLLMQLQKNASTQRYTYSSAARDMLEDPSTIYSMETMTQYNGVSQPLTGAIVFGVDQMNSDSTFAHRSAAFGAAAAAAGRATSSSLASTASMSGQVSLTPSTVADTLSLYEPEAMATSMPTPPLTDMYGSNHVPFFEDLADTRHNQFEEGFDLFFNETSSQSNNFSMETRLIQELADVGQENGDQGDQDSQEDTTSRPAKRKRSDSPSLETESLLLVPNPLYNSSPAATH